MPKSVLLVFAALLLPLACGNAFAGSGKLTCTPSNLFFGSVIGGQTKSLPTTLTNIGSATLTVSSVQTSVGFRVGLKLPLTLTVGHSVKFNISFTPPITKYLAGSVGFSSNASDPHCYVHVSGTGVQLLTANPSGLGFGNVHVGSSESQYVTVKDSSPSAVAISQATVTGAGFSLSGLNLPLTLTSGQSITFRVVFAPKSTGNGSGRISFSTNPSGPTQTVSVWGYAIPSSHLTLSPAALNFGSVTVGSSKKLTLVLNAIGGSVTVGSVTSTSSEFTLSGGSLPLTIGSGHSANLSVSFSPKSTGTATADFSFQSNGSNSRTVLPLAGTGTSVPGHSVTLSWKPSSSAVVGYNVYRSGTSGGPYTKINSVLEPGVTYIDYSVQAGKTYYYSATAVNRSGIESSHSGVVRAIIPYP